MSIDTEDSPVWEDGSPRSRGNVFNWRYVDWNGPVDRKRFRRRNIKKQISHRDRVMSALRNMP